MGGNIFVDSVDCALPLLEDLSDLGDLSEISQGLFEAGR